MIQTTLFGTKAKKNSVTRDDFFDDPEETAEKKAKRFAYARSTIYFEPGSKQFVFKNYQATQIATGHWKVVLSTGSNAVHVVTN
jgi:hypothetical protein